MNPTGPLPVGVADISATSVAPEVDRLAARLFYPCQRSWTFPCTWIPHINYARGYIGYVFKFVAKKTWKTEMTRSALISAAWALGSSRVLPVYYNPPAATPAAAPGSLPIVVFSHGLAGTRNAYSSICIELASQGYVVMALEHSDGSASCARLPRRPAAVAARAAAAKAGGGAVTGPATAAVAAELRTDSSGIAAAVGMEPRAGAEAAAGAPGAVIEGANGVGEENIDPDLDLGNEWCFYGGLGDKPEQLRKTRHRVAEVAAAYELLVAINGGTIRTAADSGGSGGGGRAVREVPAAVLDSLRGRLDLQRAAVAGHSYGGATAAAAAAALPYFRAAVSLDPWWDCFDDSWPVVNRWLNPHGAPLLVVGSDDWNSPNAEGKLKCGGVNQERVLAAAAAGGGGAVLAVPRGSTHTNFDDVMLLFGKSVSALLRLLNIRSSLEPRTAHRVNMWCITHFLSHHLPPHHHHHHQHTEHQQQQQQRQRGQQREQEGQHGTSDAGGDSAHASNPRVQEAAAGAAVGGYRVVPVREGDLEPYRQQQGVAEWLAILRLAPGGNHV